MKDKIYSNTFKMCGVSKSLNGNVDEMWKDVNEAEIDATSLMWRFDHGDDSHKST